MNGFGHDMVKAFLKNGKLEAITEYAKIRFPDRKKNVIVHSYKGSNIRMYTKNDEIHLLYPKDVSEIQMESVSEAIAKGTIFDDAEEVDNHATYVAMTNTPTRAMSHHGYEPKRLKIVLSGIIGCIKDDGTIEICASDMMNGKQFMDQMKELDPKNQKSVDDMVDHYLGTDDHDSLPEDLKEDASHIGDELEEIHSVEDDDDVITDDDYEYMDMGDGDTVHEEYAHDPDDPFQEGFFSRKPKKLKPIPRDLIPYITIELNAIKDANDQAMLSGYICSKLDLVDFYLNCIDLKDERYIVPHTREYLVGLQNQLNNLLAQVLKIKPVNRNDRVWRANVTLPEGWRG